jgi:hypothetical protein
MEAFAPKTFTKNNGIKGKIIWLLMSVNMLTKPNSKMLRVIPLKSLDLMLFSTASPKFIKSSRQQFLINWVCKKARLRSRQFFAKFFRQPFIKRL